MKILHVIPSLRKGGAERIALDLCNLFMHQGHDVKLVTFYAENQFQFITNQLDYQLVKTQLKLSLLRKYEVDVSELQSIINSFQPDVIHSHLFESEINLAFCHFPEGMRRIIHFHDNMIQMKSLNFSTFFKKSSITNYYERFLILRNLPKKTKTIGISKNSQQYISANLPKWIEKVFLPNAIDLIRFERIGGNCHGKGIIMIGSLNELKGQELAIRTIAELKKRNIICSLNLIGEGPSAFNLKLLTQSLNLESLVEFKGIVDYPEKLLQDARIYIHTSHSEAFGLVLIEAMACGLPVICTDGKGNRDLIEEGKNGFMVWERDPKQIADKIQFLLENEVEYNRVSQNAFIFAQNFGMESYAKLLMQKCYNS